MRPLSFLHEKLGFTRSEITVILFLSTTLLVGTAIRWYRDSSLAQGESVVPVFDYSRSDSEFVARSRTLETFTDRADPDVTSGEPMQKAAPPLSRIDINSAGLEDLMRLPGIGAEYARRIVAYRSEHGPFRSLESLTQVRGIGPKRLNLIRPHVRVETSSVHRPE